MKRALLLIGDGMGDRPIARLGGLTPLQAAKAPNFDRLAKEGMNGLCDVIRPGIRNGSDTGHLALLGYDPYQVYTGRGPFEAIGIGMEVRGGDIAFRCNFSSVQGRIVTDRRAGRISEGTAALAQAVNGKEIDGVTCFVKESVAHRCALVLRGPGLSPHVSDVDPHEEGQPLHDAHAIDDSDAAKKTADILNKFVTYSIEVLSNHPVNKERESQGLPPGNCIVPRGAGEAPKLTPFDELNHTKSGCVVETGLINGIGKYVGMESFHAAGTTGGLDSDLSAMGETILKALTTHNFIMANVKGPDLCGHDNLAEEKVHQIEKIDAMAGMLLERTEPGLYIALLADHATPCELGDHSGDPVALTIWGPGVRSDRVEKHDEISCAEGAIQRIRGTDVVPILTQFIDTQEKFGA